MKFIAVAVIGATLGIGLKSLPHPQAPSQSDSILEARTGAISRQLRCPVCQGESIQDSPAQLAKEMRDVIRDQIRAGKTDDEVKAYFVSKYGEQILLEPKARGFNLLVYALPWIAVLAGLGVVFVAVRKWTGTEPNGPMAQWPNDPMAK